MLIKNYLVAETNLKDEVNIQVNIDNDTINKELQEPEKQSKSDQVNLTSQVYKLHTQDKIIDTYEEKNEQTIPTKDNSRVKLSTNSLGTNHIQSEEIKQKKSQIGIDKNVVNEVGEIDHFMENICIKDRKIFEIVQKVLFTKIIFCVFKLI